MAIKNAAQNARERMIQGAINYAKFDRSDPFAFARAMSEINNGICTVKVREDDGKPCFYNAEPVTEMRKLDPGMQFSDGSNEYPVTVYRNAMRP